MDDDMSGGKTGAIYDYGFRIYDSRIAKFLSVDPLMKDYPSWSPYPFAMNRVIDGIDLDGKEWTPYEYKAGDKTVIGFEIKIKVVNSSSMSDAEIKIQATAIAENTENRFKYPNTKTNTEYRTKVILEIVDEEDIDRENDFYMEFVDNVEKPKSWSEKISEFFKTKDPTEKKTEIGGRTRSGENSSQKNKILIKARDLKDINKTKRTGTHEILHTGGEHHPTKEEVKKFPWLKDNIMRQTQYSKGETTYSTQYERVLEKVIKEIKKDK